MRYTPGIAMVMAVFACGGAAAANMTKDEYKAGKARIAAEYQADRRKCGPWRGNATDVCVARGAQKVARAELEAAYKPGPRTNYEARAARERTKAEARAATTTPR